MRLSSRGKYANVCITLEKHREGLATALSLALEHYGIATAVISECNKAIISMSDTLSPLVQPPDPRSQRTNPYRDRFPRSEGRVAKRLAEIFGGRQEAVERFKRWGDPGAPRVRYRGGNAPLGRGAQEQPS